MTIQKKIKVAFFADVLRENIDGVTLTLYNIIERVPRDRFEYLFITPYPPIKKSSVPFPVVVCPYIKFPLYQDYPFSLPHFSRKLKKVLDDYKPDIIHFTTPTFLGQYAVKYAMNNNLPLFGTYHTHFISYIDYYLFFKIFGGRNLWKKWAKQVTKWMYNRCEIVFVPTDPIKQELIELGIEGKRLITWGRGIDTKQFNPTYRDDAYIDSLASKNTKRILFVSRLVWEKEIETLLGIYKKFENTRPDIKMILTGDGPQKRYLEKNMPNAIFTGKLLGERLSKIYASCDLFLFPSITETFGNVVLEALASGLPSVVAAKGGPMGIIQPGKTGFHAKPGDVDDFCDKIVRIIDNPRTLKKMKKEALQFARMQNWDNLCKRMFDIYSKVLSKRASKNKGKSEFAN